MIGKKLTATQFTHKGRRVEIWLDKTLGGYQLDIDGKEEDCQWFKLSGAVEYAKKLIDSEIAKRILDRN